MLQEAIITNIREDGLAEVVETDNEVRRWFHTRVL